MFGILVNILCGIAGTVIVLLLQYVTRKVSEIRGPFTGSWESQITNPGSDVIVKRDSIWIRQHGHRFSGVIERVEPQTQQHRRWRIEGRIRGSDHFAIFWSIDPAVPSYGCSYLHQVGDNEFDGFYLRLSHDDHRTVTPVPIKLFRKR